MDGAHLHSGDLALSWILGAILFFSQRKKKKKENIKKRTKQVNELRFVLCQVSVVLSCQWWLIELDGAKASAVWRFIFNLFTAVRFIHPNWEKKEEKKNWLMDWAWLEGIKFYLMVGCILLRWKAKAHQWNVNIMASCSCKWSGGDHITSFNVGAFHCCRFKTVDTCVTACWVCESVASISFILYQALLSWRQTRCQHIADVLYVWIYVQYYSLSLLWGPPRKWGGTSQGAILELFPHNMESTVSEMKLTWHWCFWWLAEDVGGNYGAALTNICILHVFNFMYLLL